MPNCRLILSLVLPLFASAVLAQDLPARKQAQATRVPAGSIRVDGRLDDTAWRNAVPITDFVQTEPTEGAPASDPIDVRFVYDDTALYVGARMYSKSPIQSPLGRRDEGDQAEHLHVSLDTYLDRRTSSTFGVTAAGVRLDHIHTRDLVWEDDSTFDPVWEARTSRDEEGWTAELWIPFAQLRFNDRDPQIWGLNVRRWIPSRNEEVFWSPVLRTDERWASLFGNLEGVQGIRPARRLEILPYIAADSRVVGGRDPGDPFTAGANLAGRIGTDLKVGLGSNLTLEATVNPDFGQVEADPAEVNLSVFETFFDERRPFFLEGQSLLTGPVDNYFYSRRIGAAPGGRARGDFVESPRAATILGAAKLTGRLASGMSVGMLGAVTDEESARTFGAAQFGRTKVAPRSLYGVARVGQEFGRGSNVGLMTTVVHRDVSAGDPLATLLTRNAVTFAGDSLLRFGDYYELQSYLGVTHVDAEADALQRLQRSSARYFQRPDVDYVRFDPLRTSMTGSKGGVALERQSARHWAFEVETLFTSPDFETNDVGRLTAADGIQFNGELEYQQTTPRRWYREFSVTVGQEQLWNYGGDRQQARVNTGLDFTWPNFWDTGVEFSYEFRTQDMRLTRGGPSMERPAGWTGTLQIETSDAEQTQGEVSVGYGRWEDGGLLFTTETELSMRPAPQWQLSIAPTYVRELNTQQYVATLSGGTADTYGGRYVFGHIDRSTWATQFRLNYTFKPDLNLDFYGEPFAASGRYLRFEELLRARTMDMREGAFDLGNLDFNVQSFRSNLVLRWEWRPGSTLYLVWQQDRAAELAAASRVGLRDMFGSLRRPGDNFFAVKASFWLSPR
jgi:hypothetical protein